MRRPPRFPRRRCNHATLPTDRTWVHALRPNPGPGPRLHAAWLKPPLLNLILAGAKTVETRLSIARGPAFGRVWAGDVVYFRQTAGPYRAAALVLHAEHFDRLDPAGVREVRRLAGRAAGAGPAYWASKRGSRYASLIWLTGVRRVSAGPACERWPGFNPRAAWATLDGPRAAAWLRGLGLLSCGDQPEAASSFIEPEAHAYRSASAASCMEAR